MPCEEMSTQPQHEKPARKRPTEPGKSNEKVGEREQIDHDGNRDRPLEPGKHDSRIGERGTLDDAREVE